MAQPQIFVKCALCSCMSGPFEALTKEQLTLVDTNRTELSYRKGETLCKQGAFISNTIFIKKGLVKIYLESNTQPIIISIEKEGYFLGLTSLFDDTVFQYTAEALTPVEVCQVDINLFRQLLTENAHFAAKVVALSNKDTIKAYNRIYSLTQRQMHGRFAELILYLSDNIFLADTFKPAISRKEMADLISVSPESISRMIKEFTSDEILHFEGPELSILDKQRLKMIKNTG